MSLIDRLEEKQDRPCKFARDVLQLVSGNTGELAALIRAMDDEVGYSTRHITRSLVAEGYDITHSTVQHHRSRGCSCFRGTERAGRPRRISTD